mmetsp:Transcript_32435/g.103039  ORF Transcript_32435/g.103039 Transcript_32435/m.103039 type:complete len:148 (-) Transcript_32435:52-495(-)
MAEFPVEFSGFTDESSPSSAPGPSAPDPIEEDPTAALTLELLEESGVEHEEFTRLVCQVVREELSGCDPNDKPKIVGTLAGIMYMTKVYAAQQNGFSPAAVERAVGRLLEHHQIERTGFDRAVELHEAVASSGASIGSASDTSDDAR